MHNRYMQFTQRCSTADPNIGAGSRKKTTKSYVESADIDKNGSDINLNKIMGQMINDRVYPENSNLKPIETFQSVINNSEYDKMFDHLMSSSTFTLDQSTKSMILNYANNLQSDSSNSESESLESSESDYDTDSYTSSAIYSSSLLYKPEIVSIKGKKQLKGKCSHPDSSSTEESKSQIYDREKSCLNIDEKISQFVPTLKSKLCAEEKDRKRKIKEIRADRRKTKAANRKAFTKESMKQQLNKSKNIKKTNLNF
ncbi:hypothetical protein HZS_8034 [Henneguya salminicola]|nr:hypothetical protein HZS_8034 [Henneguya salminicola]